jgi:hypothetical protein
MKTAALIALAVLVVGGAGIHKQRLQEKPAQPVCPGIKHSA